MKLSVGYDRDSKQLRKDRGVPDLCRECGSPVLFYPYMGVAGEWRCPKFSWWRLGLLAENHTQIEVFDCSTAA